MAYEAVEKILQVPVGSMFATVGTWTPTVNAGLPHLLSTAADATSILAIPVPIPRRTDTKGIKVKEIIIPARVITANLDAAPSLALYRSDFDLVVTGATGDAVATAVAVTAGAGVVVTADANDRLWNWTVDSPAWDLTEETLAYYNAVLTLNAAATSVIRVYDAIVKYEELD